MCKTSISIRKMLYINEFNHKSFLNTVMVIINTEVIWHCNVCRHKSEWYRQGCQPLETHFSNKLQQFQYFCIISYKFQYFCAKTTEKFHKHLSNKSVISVTKYWNSVTFGSPGYPTGWHNQLLLFPHWPGWSSDSVSGCLLKGSVWELSRCRMMMGRSITLPLGSITGSRIRVSISGSTMGELTPCWWVSARKT